MKFKIKGSVLNGVISRVSHGTDNIGLVQAYSAIKIEVKDNVVKFKTMSDSISIIEEVNDVDIEIPGIIYVKCRLLQMFINNFKDEEVTIDVVEDSVMHFYSKSQKYNIPTLSDISFEDDTFSIEEEEENVTIESNVFLNGLRTVEHAASHTEDRLILNSVNVKIIENKISFIATDALRVAYHEKGIESKNAFKQTIPLKTVKNLQKLINENEKVNIAKTKNQLVFKQGEMTVFTKNLQETYPNIEKAFTEAFEQKLSIDKFVLISALEKATSLVNNEKKTVVFKINDRTISVHSTELLGSATVVADHNGIEGELIQITFNAAFVLQAVKTFKTNEIIIKFSGPLRPLIVSSNKEAETKQLILPMNNSFK